MTAVKVSPISSVNQKTLRPRSLLRRSGDGDGGAERGATTTKDDSTTLDVGSMRREEGFMTRTRHAALLGMSCVAAVLVSGACGSNATGCAFAPAGQSSGIAVDSAASEHNPVGDIPNTQVYVPFTAIDGSFTLSVPQGWTQTTAGTAVTFTDKLNTVRIDTRPAAEAPTADSVKRDETSSIPMSTGGFTVESVTRNAGDAVLVTYQAASAPNPVTGASGTDAVERYSFWRTDQEVILTLSGPTGADNVDPWRTITDSFHWR
jgi:hypothetical protein